MVRPHLKRRAFALVILGAVAIALGAGLIFRPAGLIVAGVAAILIGLFLIDVEGDEPRTARPKRPTL